MFLKKLDSLGDLEFNAEWNQGKGWKVDGRSELQYKLDLVVKCVLLMVARVTAVVVVC